MDGGYSDSTAHTSPFSRSPAVNTEECRKLFSQSSVDLSGKGLEKLPSTREFYPHVKGINFSHNSFKYINNLSKFSACIEIDASFNMLERFSSFIPLGRVLEHLDVSHNIVSNCDNLTALTNLVRLNAAYNRIESLPLLDRLINLTYLDLSSNRLNMLPNLSRLTALRTLNLNNNQISKLNDLHRTMPQHLHDFDIGGNAITDLREAQYLSVFKKIRSITFTENPCVSSQGRTFCYRPYLYCCCLERLSIVDGKELSETEIIKGEELHTSAKIRRMETHAQLCAYLAKECPKACNDSFSPDGDRLLKVLKKRREYKSKMKDETGSEESTATTVSPYREWLSKSASSIPSRIKNSDFVCEQRENPKSRNDLNDSSSTLTASYTSPPSSARSSISSSTVTLSAPTVSYSSLERCHIKNKMPNKPAQTHKILFSPSNTPKKSNVGNSNCNLSTRREKLLTRNVTRSLLTNKKTFNLSSDTKTGPTTQSHPLPSVESFRDISFVSARNARDYSDREKGASVVIQSWWRGVRVRRRYRALFFEKRIRRCESLIREKSETISELRNRLTYLEQDIDKFRAVNEQQALWIQEMRKFMTQIVEKCNERQKCLLSKLLPVPGQLQYIRKSETEVVVQWQNCQCLEEPRGYLVTVDGFPCGTVRGTQKKALVTDLDPKKESVIKLKCVFDEFDGSLSESLVIPPCKQETEPDSADQSREAVSESTREI